MMIDLRHLQGLIASLALTVFVAKLRADSEVLESINKAGQANTVGYRNFEVSIRTVYDTTRVPADKQADPYERKDLRVIHARLWIDYEKQRCVYLTETLTKKESTNAKDLVPRTIKSNPPGATPNEYVIDYRKGHLEQECSSYQDGKLVATSLQNPQPYFREITFGNFLRGRLVLRYEVAAMSGTEFLLFSEPIEERMAQQGNAIKPPDSERRLEDGTFFVARSDATSRLELYYPPGRSCYNRFLIFDIRNAQERLISTQEKTFDDFDLVDRPKQCKTVNNYQNQPDFVTGDPCDTSSTTTMDFQWHQFNADELNWPDFDVLAKSQDKIHRVVTEGWDDKLQD